VHCGRNVSDRKRRTVVVPYVWVKSTKYKNEIKTDHIASVLIIIDWPVHMTTV